MDNGHLKGNTDNPYFTAGVGNISPEVNSDLENSIDKDDWERSLKISAPVNMPAPEQIISTETVNTGIANTEVLAPIISEQPTPENSQELGQIVPVNPVATMQPNPIPDASQKYNPINIRTTGDHLEKSTIPEVDNVISELNQTGNLNNFYDEIRGTDEKPGMMEANLQNSFNRKLGQDQGKVA